MFRFTYPTASRWILVAALFALSEAATAGTVVLKDGTIINGDVESLSNGVYTVETGSLGRVQVPQEQVRSIDLGDGPGPASGARSPSSAALPVVPDFEATKARISEDPKLMALLLGLESDPDVLAVVQDPEVMKDMAAGDYTALMSNPKIVALMSNPKIREIVDALR